jgi:hypothetical protein
VSACGFDLEHLQTLGAQLLAQPRRVLVAEAGGNALLAVRSNGSISTIATFPSVPQGRPRMLFHGGHARP